MRRLWDHSDQLAAEWLHENGWGWAAIGYALNRQPLTVRYHLDSAFRDRTREYMARRGRVQCQQRRQQQQQRHQQEVEA